MKLRPHLKIITIHLIISTLFCGQYFDSAYGSSRDNLAPAIVSSEINPERSAVVRNEVANEINPGAIGNGSRLSEFAGGTLPPRIMWEDIPLREQTLIRDKVRRSAGIAFRHLVGAINENKLDTLHLRAGETDDLGIDVARVAKRKLQKLRKFTLRRGPPASLYLFHADVRGIEDYLLGFSNSDSIGLSIELIYALKPELLAQYIFHECIPEKGVIEREYHKAVYDELQGVVFTKKQVRKLKNRLRKFIDEHSVVPTVKSLLTPELLFGSAEYDELIYRIQHIQPYLTSTCDFMELPGLIHREGTHIVTPSGDVGTDLDDIIRALGEGAPCSALNLKLRNPAYAGRPINNIRVTMVNFPDGDITFKTIDGNHYNEIALYDDAAGILNIYVNSVYYFDKYLLSGTKRKVVQVMFHALLDKVLGRQEAGEAIGYSYKTETAQRRRQIEALLDEIEKEEAIPGSGALPHTEVIGDLHGGLPRFAQLLSSMLHRLCGFQGRIDPRVSIEDQLNSQNLSLKTLNGSIIINGDILDRGEFGIACFKIVKELVETAPDRIFFIPGNHDIWAVGGILGIHLPWYGGYTCDGDAEAEDLLQEHRRLEPDSFDSFAAFEEWAGYLDKYNKYQNEFNKSFEYKFNDDEQVYKAKALREKFNDYFKEFRKEWNTNTQQGKDAWDAWEKFVGHFARIEVTDPFVGLNGMGNTSADWWAALMSDLQAAYRARSDLITNDEERQAWTKALEVCGEIERQVKGRLAKALRAGNWRYRIFESINRKAYLSEKWGAKDWVSHDKWGEGTFKEISDGIHAGVFHDSGFSREETVTAANYPRSAILKEYALFCLKHFNLYHRDAYGHLITHAWFPVSKEGIVSISYRSRQYTGKDIFIALDEMSSSVKNAAEVSSISGSMVPIVDALREPNRWYMDLTTEIKPNNVKINRKLGIAVIQGPLGVLIWITGHNTINKLGGKAITEKDDYVHIESDGGMSPKFGKIGHTVYVGPEGVRTNGFSYADDEEVVDSPPFIVKPKTDAQEIIVNLPISRAKFLQAMKRHLKRELAELSPPAPEATDDGDASAVESKERSKMAGELERILEDLPDHAEAFVRNLKQIQARLNDPKKIFFIGIETIPGIQRPQLKYKALSNVIENTKGPDGKRMFPNVRLTYGSARYLATFAKVFMDSGALSMENAFIAARKCSIDDPDYGLFKDGESWITVMDDSQDNSYLAVIEGITLSMMAYQKNGDLSDIDDIKKLYDAISDPSKPINLEQLREMVTNRIIYVDPRKVDINELPKLYRRAYEAYVAA